MRKKPVQQRSRQMVTSIIDASARVVAEEGLAALTTNRVAEVAGISNGSLYQYFHDRHDLLEALAKRASDDVIKLFDAINAQLELDNSVDLRAMSRASIKVALDFMRTQPLYLELIRNWSEVPLQAFLEPMERYFYNSAQQYLIRYAAGRYVQDLPARYYMLFNSVFFNLLRFVSEPGTHIREYELVEALAESIEALLMRDEKAAP